MAKHIVFGIVWLIASFALAMWLSNAIAHLPADGRRLAWAAATFWYAIHSLALWIFWLHRSRNV